MTSSTRIAAPKQGACGRFLSARVWFCFVILVAFAAFASAQTTVSPTTNTILFSGQTANSVNTGPTGGIILQGTAISQITGQPVRHLWVADTFASICRMDPEIDAPGPWDINTLTCTYSVTRAGAAIPIGGEFAYDAARHFLYFVDNNSASQGVIRIGFDPAGDGGQGALDLTNAFTLAGGANARRGPFLGGTGCPFPGTGTIPDGAALSPLGDLWVGFLDSGDILRFNSPATATETGFGTCDQFVQLVATTPDGVSSNGLAWIGHDLWAGDGTSPFFIPNADTTCLVPPNGACSTANGTVIPTLPQVGATVSLHGDQFYPNINGNNLYYGTGSQVTWVGNVAAGTAAQTLDTTYMDTAGITPAPNPPLAAMGSMAVDGTDPANLVVYSAEDPVAAVILGQARWWQTSQPINANGVPGVPLDVVAVAGDSQITVSWSPAQSAVPVTSYTVRNSFISTGTPLADITVNPAPGSIYPPTSLLIPGLINGVSYAFQVEANNGGRPSGFSAQSNIATPPGILPPSAPTGVTALAGDTQAFISWTVSASNGGSPITSYTVTVLSGGIPTGITVTVPPPVFTSNTGSALIGGLTNGVPYTFTVHATNIAGDSPESAPSNEIIPSTANTTAPSIAMSGPTSVTTTGNQITYTIDVSNTSNFQEANVSVADTLNTDPANISTISRDANGLVTVTITSTSLIIFNDTVTIAGVLDPSFNGTFTVTNAPTTSTFTYSQAGLGLPVASSIGGTATVLPTANILSVQTSQGTCTGGGASVVSVGCTIGFMEPGTSAQIHVIAQMQKQSITNSATVSGTDFAGTPLPTASASVTTAAPSPAPSGSGVTTDLQITGSAHKGGVKVNDPDFYTWQVKDNKPIEAPGVVMTNVLPDSLEFSSVTTDLGTCVGPAPGTLGGTVTCTVSSLGAAGAPNQFNVQVNVIVRATGTIMNTGTVTFNGTDSNPGNDSFTVKITGQ